jgi:hypothetical protein
VNAVMQDSAAQTCPHGLRPGTTVCLRCRQDERNAARQRRCRVLTRAGLLALAGALVLALVIGGIMAVTPNRSVANTGADDGIPATVVEVSSSRTRGDTSAPAAAATTLRPAIAEGRKELAEGMYAVREGPEVTVYFDTELLRTRFDWKFEGIVRSTLPVIYGDAARTALDSITTGSLVRGGTLLEDLPQHGFPISVAEHTVRLWPVVRPGRDGPLIVAYRAKAE